MKLPKKFWTPKPRRGEYVWRATAYRYKVLENAEDVPLFTERFFYEREAVAWKKATEAGISKCSVRITKTSIVDEDGFTG